MQPWGDESSLASDRHDQIERLFQKACSNNLVPALVTDCKAAHALRVTPSSEWTMLIIWACCLRSSLQTDDAFKGNLWMTAPQQSALATGRKKLHAARVTASILCLTPHDAITLLLTVCA